MKVVSYNVNGIRAAIKKGLIEWLKKENPDVFCIQESKAQPEQVDMEPFTALGYHNYWHSAKKPGYSGVVTFSKKEPTEIIAGIGMDKYDSEGRVLLTEIEGVNILNIYFPSGSSGDERHDFKMEFLADLRPFVNKLISQNKKIIVVGDYNIVRLDIDIHNPKGSKKRSGFKPEERAWLNQWFNTDFIDTFRHFEPDTEHVYSWWTYRMGAKAKNKGWRIDYISCTKNIKKSLASSKHHTDVVFSDHCPIETVFNL